MRCCSRLSVRHLHVNHVTSVCWGRLACIFVGNSDIVLFGKLLPISFVAAHHPDHRGVVPARGSHFRLRHQWPGSHSRLWHRCGRETSLLNGRFGTANLKLDNFGTFADCREPSRSHGNKFVSHNDVINPRFIYSRKQVCQRKFAPSKNFPLYGSPSNFDVATLLSYNPGIFFSITLITAVNVIQCV